MSEAARRLAEEMRDSCVHTAVEIHQVSWVFEWLLAKIRERREEIAEIHHRGLLQGKPEFWSLFDDGAEFGPDEKGPKIIKMNSELLRIDHGHKSDLITIDGYRAIQEGPKLEDL